MASTSLIKQLEDRLKSVSKEEFKKLLDQIPDKTTQFYQLIKKIYENNDNILLTPELCCALEGIEGLENCFDKLYADVDETIDIQVKNLEDQISSEIKELNEKLKSEVKELDEKLKSEVKDLEKNLKSEVDELIDHLKLEVIDLENSLNSDLNDLNEKLDDKITDLNNKRMKDKDELKTMISNMQEESKISLLETKIEIYQKIQETIDEQEDEQEDDQENENELAIELLAKNLTNIKNELSVLTTNVANEFDETEIDLNLFTSQLTAVNTKVDKLENDFEKMNARLTKLESLYPVMIKQLSQIITKDI